MALSSIKDLLSLRYRLQEPVAQHLREVAPNAPIEILDEERPFLNLDLSNLLPEPPEMSEEESVRLAGPAVPGTVSQETRPSKSFFQRALDSIYGVLETEGQRKVAESEIAIKGAQKVGEIAKEHLKTFQEIQTQRTAIERESAKHFGDLAFAVGSDLVRESPQILRDSWSLLVDGRQLSQGGFDKFVATLERIFPLSTTSLDALEESVTRRAIEQGIDPSDAAALAAAVGLMAGIVVAPEGKVLGSVKGLKTALSKLTDVQRADLIRRASEALPSIENVLRQILGKRITPAAAKGIVDSPHWDQFLRGVVGDLPALTERAGGSTRSFFFGPAEGSNLWAVSFKTLMTKDAPLDVDDIVNAINKLDPAFKQLLLDKRVGIGTWVDDGKRYVELSFLVPDDLQAYDLGNKLNQIGIFHLGSQRFVSTGGTGNVPNLTAEQVRKLLDEIPQVGKAGLRAYDIEKFVATNQFARELAGERVDEMTKLAGVPLRAVAADVIHKHRLYGRRAKPDKFDELFLSEIPENARQLFDQEKLKLIYDSGTKLLNQVAEYLPGRMISRMSGTQRLLELFKRGEELGSHWYDGAFDEMKKLFGNEEDARILSGFIAIFSPNTDVKQNVHRALKAFFMHKGGMTPEQIQANITKTPLPGLADNIKRIVHGLPINGNSPKVSNFFESIVSGGERGSAVDRFMLQAFGLDTKLMITSPGRPAIKAGYNDIVQLFTKKTSDFAREIGVAPARAQGAIWAGWKLEQDDPAGIEPLAKFVKEELKRIGDDGHFTRGFEDLFDKIKDEQGAVRLGTALFLARAMLGAGAGAALSEDDIESRITGALAGVGIAASPELLRGAVKLARQAGLINSQPLSIRPGVSSSKPRTSDLGKVITEYVARVGNDYVPNEVTIQRGRELLASGELRPEFLKFLEPGKQKISPQVSAYVEYAGSKLDETVALADKYLRVKPRPGSREERQLRQSFEKSFTELVALLGGVDIHKGDVGRALQVLQEPTIRNEQLKRAGRTLKRISQGGVEITDVMHAFTQLSTEEIGKALKRIRLGDALYEGLINSWLWTIPGHITNVLVNSSFMALNLLEKGIAEKLFGTLPPGTTRAAVKGVQDAIFHRRGPQDFEVAGVVGGFMDAWTAAGRAFRGLPIGIGDTTKLGKFSGNISSELVKQYLGENLVSEALGNMIDFLGGALRLGGRGLLAEDGFAKTVASRMLVYQEAYRRAFAEISRLGLKGAVAEQEAAKRAAQLVEEWMRAGVPAELRSRINTGSGYLTFTGPLGELGETVGRLSDSPGLRYFLPFLRVGMRVSKALIERTPLGLYNVAGDLMTGDRAQAAEHAARVISGTLLLGFGAALAHQGYLVGSPPPDTESAGLFNTIYKRDSLVLPGGETISISRMQIPGLFLALGADIAQLMQSISDDDIDDRGELLSDAVMNLIEHAATSLATHLQDQSVLQSAARSVRAIVTALSGNPDPGSTREIQRLLAGFAQPLSVGSQITQALDPTIKEIESLRDAIWVRVPGLSEKVPPRLDLFGQPVQSRGVIGGFSGFLYDMASPLVLSKHADQTTRDIYNEFMRLQANVPSNINARHPKEIEGVPLFADERTELAKLTGKVTITGQSLKDNLREAINSDWYKRLSDEQRVTLINSRIAAYRQLAIAEFLNRRSEVRDRIVSFKVMRAQQQIAPSPNFPLEVR